MKLRVSLLLLLPLVSAAFVVPKLQRDGVHVLQGRAAFSDGKASNARIGTLTLNNSKRENDVLEEAAEKKGKPGIDSGLRTKLLSESIAPWRTVRLFLYASLGSGALLGGFITLSGVAAALSGARSDVDLNTEYINLAIDFGAALALGIFFKLDLDKGAELNQDVEKKLERKKADKKIAKAMEARESSLSELTLKIRVSEDGKETKEAPVAAVQSGAKQHMIIVAGERKAIRDALLSANLMQMDFALRDVIIIPYEIGAEVEKLSRPSGGFGERPTWESANYVAECVGDGWKDYIGAEMADAVEQNGEQVKEEGIAIVVKNTGKVIRRGVGRVPWREMVDELEGKKEDDVEMADLSFLTPGQ
uniref:Uncharacterized protein n=1 Tax=Pseudictyota dubia TaxID=2749911 RepID=A0A7R9WKJ5_9STRA|mmetsp:Transcript_9417/g.17700  ORF Transcript_9417/g.17700 Transcript_9417/m.17700 type:complete len:362 (+) Transcript_9417:142-1227(+)